nr:polyprotein [Phytophthora cactorum bunyavirus 1]
MPEHSLNISTRRLLDLGGSGDCFFIAIKAALGFWSKLNRGLAYSFDTSRMYELLGIPDYTYIEDHHIAAFIDTYPFSLVVVREYKGECVFQQYGVKQDTVYMFNDFPTHYLLFDQAYFNGEFYSYSQLSDLRVQEEQVVEVQQEVQMDKFPDIYEVKVKLYDDPAKCYLEDPDLGYLYQYVDSRFQIRGKGYQLSALDSKIYYKLRHNVFKTMFLNSLSLESIEEKPFTEYGVDSNRTPDLILVLGTKFLIVEFTVVKRFVTSLQTKKSQNKYAAEVDMLQNMGYTVCQYYPTLSLDEPTSSLASEVLEISTLLEKTVFVDLESMFSNLQSELNALEYNIAELIPELLLNQEESRPLEIKAKIDRIEAGDLFQTQVLKIGLKRQRDQSTFSLIRKNFRPLERQLKSTRYSARFVIIVNRRHNRVYADVDSTGLQKNRLLSLIQNNSMDVLKYVQYVGTQVDTDEPFKIFGDSKIEIGENRKLLEKKVVDLEPYERYFKGKLKRGSDNRVMNTLVDSDLSIQAPKVKEKYYEALKTKRQNPRIKIYNKNWFIFPVLTSCTKGEFTKLTFETGLPLTDRLLRVCSPKKVEKVLERNNDMNKLDKVLQAMNKSYMEFLQSVGNDRKKARLLKNIYDESSIDSKLNELGLDAAVKSTLKEYQSYKKKLTNEVGESTRTSYRNRITLSASYLKANWPLEMEHFNGVKSDIKVCENKPLEQMEGKVKLLLDELWSEVPESTTDDVFSNTEPLGNKLSEILIEMREMGNSVLEPLRKTRIMHDLEFLSRLAYTILFYSNIKSNKEDFFHDNVGYTDALIFVKGGKKILSHKKSRLFKLIFPISSGFEWLYASSSTTLVKHNEKTYCVLPWQTWSFSMLKKATELYYSFSNYFVCGSLESGVNLEDYKKFNSAKVLNMYSQRRKVEIWFGFFRYLYLNSMSTHTNVLELIEDMADFEYDPYFSYCQKVFAEKYSKIYEHAKEGKIFDIMTDVVVENFDLCAEKFDESIFMTVAPFDRVNEHLRNLRSVLKVHKDVNDKFGLDPLKLLDQTAVSVYDDDYFTKLASDDLMFDPQLCYAVGNFAGEHISKCTSLSEMSSQFAKMVNRSYTDISTSKGLRSNRGHFWGEKGHDVIFGRQSMLDKVKGFLGELPTTNSEFRKKLVGTEESFRTKIESLLSITLEFDIKDKAQWKGSREIYVMSENTKLVQSPLEKFFKLLCTWAPNELIHKKSHVRPKFIHGQIFEFEDSKDESLFATLDCRKWAPKSNLWKYYYFVKGMSPFLPEEFVEYFFAIWSLMFSKKVRIQSAYVDMLKKNPETLALTDLLDCREDGDYEFTMPYSFMMGIFNYLSSLLHAFSQLYFDNKIARAFGVSFNLLAHSDDSGGVVFSDKMSKNYEMFRMYEMFQKGLNHLMSKKKCSLSSKFFEMISIMYANRRLIPMTHKFLANVSFEPKGKGWVDDISTIVSKVVEIFSNGGSMLQCYLTMITMSEMIRKFYHVPRLSTLSSIPLAYGGVFNTHPIHLILLGADAQEILLDALETPGERGFRVAVGQSIFGEYFPGKGCNVNYHIPYYKRHNLSGEFESEEMDVLKLFSSVNPETTLGQAAGHYSRLRDPAYVYSLSGVDMCQIFVTTLFSKIMVLNSGANKRCDLRRLSTKYSVLKALGLFSGKSSKSYSNFHHYAKSSESVKIKLSDINVSSKKTCKPIVYDTFSNLGMGLNFRMLNEIVAYRKEPKLHFMFPDKVRMETLVNWVKSNLQYSGDYSLEDYLMKISGKELEKTRSSYCFIPSGISVDTVERFWTYVNFYCTRRYFINSQKPQYFTIDQFKLWNADYDGIKHMYLIVKVALRCPMQTEIFDKLKENSLCKSCSYSEASKNIIDEIFRLRGLPSYSFFETNLPFAVYTSPQYRAVNVWYGKAEFILYTQFGTVEITKRFGESYHIYSVLDTEVLDQIYFLLTNFLTTRGLMEPQITYSINDTSEFKLGFGDLNQPRVVYPGERSMMQVNSIVYIRELPKFKLYKDGEKFTLDGSPVDFEMYQNYDVNEGFYKSHNLGQIKDLIFDEEKIVSNDELKTSALSSKIYEVIQCDPTHSAYGTLEDKYAPGYLLGSERSLTRALAVASDAGVTQYRSTSTPTVLDTAVFEGMSHKDIPVLDLAETFSFSRVTHKERLVMEKLVNEGQLREDDVPVLDRMVAKMGLKPTLNAITTTSVIFSDLIYWDVLNLSANVLQDYLISMTKSALSCLSDKFNKTPEYYIQGTAAQCYLQLSTAMTMNASTEMMGELLTKTYMRAQKTDPGRFWNERKDSLYAALVVPRTENFKNQCLFNQAVLNKLKGAKYTELKNLRQIRLADRHVSRNFSAVKSKILKIRKKGCEYLTGTVKMKDLEERNYYLDEDNDEFEDNMDMINGGDDPEEYCEREWSDDSPLLKAFIFNNVDERAIAEKTLMSDFSEVQIYSPVLIPNFPWLGPCDSEIESFSGVPFYCTSYPGKLRKLRTMRDMKELKIDRIESKPVPISERISEGKWSGKMKVKSDIFNLTTEEEVYEYQRDVLKAIGIQNVEHHERNFFKLREVKNEDYFWKNFFTGLNIAAESKIAGVNVMSKRRSNVLPGFTGNLKDDDVRAELNAMFSGHAEEIVSGNQCLSEASFRTILRNFRRLYRENKDPNLRAYIIIMLSTMRDCVIGKSSDGWYADSLMAALDSMEEDLSNVRDDDAPPPIRTRDFTRNYKIKYPFDP